tara:strand:+ start:8889 stop:10193 length:1305 start_codon:yes stop_codon:yes gene_type:complete
MNINLFVQNVKTNNSVRNKEYEKCLLLNTYNRYIDNIFIINTENGMLTYGRFIEFTKIFPDDINILSNADIFFDESIDLCRHMGDDDAYALSRWDLPKGTLESKFLDAHVVKSQSRSQDTWIVKGAVKKGINGAFCLGQRGCDNVFAQELESSGYNVSNPCLDIIANHLHTTPFRTSSQHSTVDGKRKFPEPCHLKPIHDLKSKKITMYTFYTGTHKRFYDEYFFPSVTDCGWSCDDIVVTVTPQRDPEGSWGDARKPPSTGFNQTMKDKWEWTIKTMENDDSDYIIWSDPDVQYFSPFIKDLYCCLGDNDFAGQLDCEPDTICLGFFIFKNNDKNMRLFKHMLSDVDKYMHDQEAFNQLKDEYITSVSLCPKRYYTIGYSNNRKAWSGEDISPEKKAILHHGNWTVGVENKIKCMNLVRDKINVKQSHQLLMG